MSEDSSSGILKYNVFIDMTFIAAYISVSIYIVGWFYFYEYFSFFSLGLYELDIKYEQILTWGALGLVENVIIYSYCYTLLIVSLYAGFYIFSNFGFIEFKKIGSKITPVMLVVSFIFLPIAGIYAGREKVNKVSVGCKYSNFPTVKITTAKGSGSSDFSSGEYRLLLRNSDSHYLIKSPSSKPIVWSLSNSTIEVTKIYPANQNCQN